ncbi:MAG TPA: OB-fold nucleic acid binding domain-containing protein [Longimicrobiales bacterium]|nr:OB-fold nucleic acid binding domain-containing protein [Longimicrobiales bacterium]
MRSKVLSLLSVVALTALAACKDGDPTSIDERTGAVAGGAFIDRDLNGAFTAGDAPAGGVVVGLLLEATGDTMETAITEADGSFLIDRVAIGQYRLVARRGATLGDTVEVLAISNATFSVTAADTVVRVIPLGYPTVTVAAARALPAGRRVMVTGIALNTWTAFADSTVHLRDASGSIRAVRTSPSPLQAGDSIRIFGTTALDNGQAVLADASVRLLSPAVGVPAPDSVGTGVAATADGGARADGQVRIAGATILDTTSVAGDRVLGVDDGSGRLEVVLDRNVQFDAGPWVPGARFHGSGVLVPDTAGGWQLKPRHRTEASVTFPSMTIAAARATTAGLRVVVEGIALNGWFAFADSTVHIADATGAIRGVRVLGFVGPGDSIRLSGTVATRNGQPVLSNATVALLSAAVGLPALDSVSTSTAASAQGGVRDAGQVRIGGSITGTQNLPSGDVILTVNDGSGAVQVLFDRDIAFNPGPYQPGALLRASGVLVPTGTGTWQLKPRSRDDATAFYPTVTVAGARALQPGQTAYVAGMALNGTNTFGDSTVHVQDASGAIRFTTVPGAPPILAGYAVTILGTAGVLNGTPIMRASSVSQVSVGTLPAPDSVSTATAASAQGGTRDAGQVAVSGTIVAAVTVGSDILLAITDGTGTLEVVLDAAVGFNSAAYQVGDSIRARGVLVPKTTGTVWQLKPRAVNEVAVN